jgi:hypothetical protein
MGGKGGANKMSSPTFVATFADGTTTRMTTFCEGGKLDLGRGVRLSQAAYESRRKQQPPAMTAGHFETPPNGDGRAAMVLRTYSPDKLAAVTGGAQGVSVDRVEP